jgi:glycosyltransferase involved in cell wall biosynthesis
VRVPDARLIVQGDGGEHERVIADLRRIGGNIDLRDSVEISGLAASLAEADLQLVLQAESAVAFNLPSKALSAAAAGVPFLTNAPAGSPVAKFAADSGGGWVVPRGDAAEMADAAAALLADPGRLLSMATSGLAFVRRNHERTRLIDRYLELSLAADA